jgi:Domain of unknown function (DUF4129)
MSRLGRWVPIAAVVALLAAAMLASAYANPTIENLPRAAPATGAPQRNQQEAEAPLTALPTVTAAAPAAPAAPAWVGWLVSVLCLAGVLVIVGMLVWFLIRDRLAERRVPLAKETVALPAIAETQRKLRSAVDEGLAELDDTDADPRRAVIACWVRLEQAAAEAGAPRTVGDTSTDLVARLLASHLVNGAILAAFSAVYREARFATHAVDVGMRDQARSALRRLREELASGIKA